MTKSVETSYYELPKLGDYAQVFTLNNYGRHDANVANVMREVEALRKPTSKRPFKKPLVFAIVTTCWDPNPEKDHSPADNIYQDYVVGANEEELEGYALARNFDLIFCKDVKDFMKSRRRDMLHGSIKFYSLTTNLDLIAETEYETVLSLGVDVFEFPKLKRLMKGLGLI